MIRLYCALPSVFCDLGHDSDGAGLFGLHKSDLLADVDILTDAIACKSWPEARALRRKRFGGCCEGAEGHDAIERFALLV